MNLLRFWIALAVLAIASQADESTLVGRLGAEPFALQFASANAAGGTAAVSVKAGSVWRTAEGAAFIALRAAETTAVSTGAPATWSLPAAALSTKAAWKPGALLAGSKDAEPRVAPLLTYLATRNDVPRETSQLVVLVLTENISFADWQTYLVAMTKPEPALAAADVAVALDALTILRTVAPQGQFALASDAGLKMRALHDPILRGKARQLFGLTVPGDAPAGGVGPDLGQLLHSKVGDNCPVCRLRTQMQRPGDLP